MTNRPLIAVTLALGLGIWLGNLLSLPLGALWILWASALLGFCFTVKKYEIPALGFLLLGFFGLGNFLYQQKHAQLYLNPWAGYLNRSVVVEGEVEDFPYIKNDTLIFNLRVEKIREPENTGGALLQVRIPESGRFSPVYWGEKLRVRGELSECWGLSNPNGFNYRLYLARQGVRAVLTVKEAQRPEILPSGFSYKVWLSRSREKFLTALDRGFSPETSGLLLGIVLGETHQIDREIYQVFRESGTLHILAASGTNVAVFSGFIFLVLGWLGFSHRQRVIPAVLAIVFYAFLAAFSPSVVRAAIMASFALLAVFLGREDDILNLLFLSAFLILLHNPLTLYDVSFQMSFLCVLGIFWLYPAICEPLKQPLKKLAKNWPEWLRRLPLIIWEAAAISLSAQIMLLPVLAGYFHQLSLIGALANLLIVPLSGVMMIGGVAQALLGLINPYLTWPLLAVNWVLGKVLLALAFFFAGLPGAFCWVTAFSTLGFIAYYGVIYLGFGMLRLKILGWRFWAMLILLPVLLLSRAYPRVPETRLTFFDLGKGRCAWLALPDGRNWLFDAGAYDYGGAILSHLLLANRVNRIDALFIASSHPYRTGQAVSLLEKIPVKNLYWAKNGADYFLDPIQISAEKRGVKLHVLRLGDCLEFPGGELRVLAVGGENSDLTLQLAVGGEKVLLPGEEPPLIHPNADWASGTVLTGRAELPPEFWKTVKPHRVVIAGEESLVCPSPRYLDALREMGAQPFQLCREGAVQLRFGTKKLTVIKQKQQEEAEFKENQN